MENAKEFLAIVFKPIWAWFIGGIMALIAVAEFIWPSLQSVITWPAMSKVLPGYFWLALAFFIWALGIAWEVAKRVNKEPAELEELSMIRKEGVELRNFGNNQVKDNDAVLSWIKDYSIWDKKMIDKVKELSKAEAGQLETLDRFMLQQRLSDVNFEHSKYLSMLNEKLTRLYNFIHDYSLSRRNDK